MARRAQMPIKGTEIEQIKEVDDAAEAYEEARDARMKKTVKETDAKNALIAAMKKHSLTVYRDDAATPPIVVTMVPGKDNVKVARAGEDDGEGEDEGGET